MSYPALLPIRTYLCRETLCVLCVNCCEGSLIDASQGGCQIDTQRGLRTGEGGVKLFERPGQDPHGVGVSKSRECMTTPSIEMNSLEKEERELRVDRVSRQ